MRKLIASALVLLTLSGTAHAELYVPTSYPYAAAAIAPIRVRVGPSSNQNQVDLVQRGERLKIISCENAFCFAERQNGGPSGWVHSDFFVPLKPEPEATPVVTTPNVDPNKVWINRPLLNSTIKFGN